MKISIDAIAQSPQDQYLAKLASCLTSTLVERGRRRQLQACGACLTASNVLGGSHGMMSIIMWWISHKYHMSGCDGIAVSIKRSTTFSSCKKGSDDLWVFPVLPRRHCSPSINHHFFLDHRKSSISCTWHVFGSILFQASKSWQAWVVFSVGFPLQNHLAANRKVSPERTSNRTWLT